jgi:hypothetical protein
MSYFPSLRYLRGQLRPRPQAKQAACQAILMDTESFPIHNKALMAKHKNKTLATTLAFALGGLGAHRFYLHGGVDRLGLLHVCSVPLAGLVYSVGHGPNPFFVLLPIIVSWLAGFLAALVIGLTPDERWDARHNAARIAAGGRGSRSRWPLAVLLVLTMLVGATALIATIARLFDLLYTGGAYG